MAFAKPSRSLSCIFSLLIISMAIATHGVHSAFLTCEELPTELCAFSVSSTGNRCVLEKALKVNGILQFQCQSSAVMAEKLAEWIESEECINACGLEQMAVGMSTDFLLESESSRKLCSSKCRNNCPNIVDLYVNLAEGEGISLPSMCESQKTRSRKLIAESQSSSSKSSIRSESYGAPGPYGSHIAELGTSIPAPAPVYGATAELGIAPAPVYGTPSYTGPAPVYGTPPELATAPAPVYGTPPELATAPAPVYGTPSYTVPAPVYGTPPELGPAPAATPIYGTPPELATAPAPAYGTPAPAATPIYGAPAELGTAPAPAYGTPVPAATPIYG